MVNHTEHHYRVEVPAGTLKERRAFGIAPSNAWGRSGEIDDERQDVQTVRVCFPPHLADDDRIIVNRHDARAAARSDRAEVTSVTSNIQNFLWLLFAHGVADKRLLQRKIIFRVAVVLHVV